VKKSVLLLAFISLMIGMLAGCGTDTAAKTKIITDCSGAEVEIPSDLNKVVVTNPSAVAFMTAMGLSDKIVGTHGSILNQSWVYVFDETFNDVALFGKNPNAEELIAKDIDLVIIKDAKYAEELRKSGINAVCFKYTNKEELYFALDMLGEIFGKDAKSYASKWKTKLDTTIETIAKDLSGVSVDDRHRVYYVDATGAEATRDTLYLTSGGGSFVEFWVNSSGGKLVTSPYEGIDEIDQETALTLRPDTIFICGWLEYTAKDVLMSDPLWQDVPAVKNDRVFLMPTSFVSYDRFSVELPLMLDYTAHLLYPDKHAFNGIDDLREFYKQYYNQSLNDDQLENLLKGLNPDGTRMESSND
jgi:iron complex transport system substrate-binding protein